MPDLLLVITHYVMLHVVLVFLLILFSMNTAELITAAWWRHDDGLCNGVQHRLFGESNA